MPSTHTCQRCLSSLRTAAQVHARAARQSPAGGAKRWLSGQSNPLTKARTTAAPGQLKKTTASISTQGYSTGYDTSDVQVPPGLASRPSHEKNSRPLLQPDNLFHSFTNSPSVDIRRRAAFIKQHAYCPHASHSQTRQPNNPDDPEAHKPTTGGLPPAHVSYECPDCGIPVSCSEEHFADDYEQHLEICDTLRQINEDDHDLRSGRFFPEFRYPGPQMDEALINMTNWDTFLYSRQFNAINEDRSMRQATRLLTYPVTIGSVLHELSPYNIRRGGRLTTEGLKSLSGKSNIAIHSGAFTYFRSSPLHSASS